VNLLLYRDITGSLYSLPPSVGG